MILIYHIVINVRMTVFGESKKVKAIPVTGCEGP
jgi:hypothetical protein